MNFKKTAAVALLGLASLTMTACSEDTLTESEFAEGITEGGVDEAVAECIAAEVYGELGEDAASDAYDNEGEPSEEEKTLLTEATAGCAGGEVAEDEELEAEVEE